MTGARWGDSSSACFCAGTLVVTCSILGLLAGGLAITLCSVGVGGAPLAGSRPGACCRGGGVTGLPRPVRRGGFAGSGGPGGGGGGGRWRWAGGGRAGAGVGWRVGAGEDEAPLVACDGLAEPLGARV